jgi:hypothetical protein
MISFLVNLKVSSASLVWGMRSRDPTPGGVGSLCGGWFRSRLIRASEAELGVGVDGCSVRAITPRKALVGREFRFCWVLWDSGIRGIGFCLG